MKTTTLSSARISRIREQGYRTQSDQEISQLAFGHRFAFRLCLTVLTIGLITANYYLLFAMMAIAFLSIILPYHPFDYIYNNLVRKWVNKPVLPKRSAQLKFACVMAVPWIGGIIYSFYTGNLVSAYTLGGLLMTSAFLVGFLDRCLPSKIYNYIFEGRSEYTKKYA